jgi:hypothetical protein
MEAGKIFKIFKKGAKAGVKYHEKKGQAGSFAWPAGVRIGVYGHSNSGKTVYFTVLHEECKISKELQISVTENATAGEFLANYRSLWGVGTAVDSGTMVDRRGEKKFPDPTIGDKVLLFNAFVDRKKKYSVVTYDYSGKAVSLSDRADLREKALDFFMGCNGLLFFFDPKTLAAELQCQEHVAAFVSMLEHLAPLHSRLPIPIGLVISKADILPGFTGDNQTVLINAEDENFLAEEFEIFLDRVLSSNKIASNSAWAGSVRNLLIKLREFLKIIVGRTLDFQIFFVSSTGQTPEKIGADVGRSIYLPPAKIQPVGVREPFHWMLNSISRSRKISGFRKVAKFITVLSLIWIILFSIPFLYHLKILLPGAEKNEREVLQMAQSSAHGMSPADRERVINEYKEYRRAFTVRTFFDDFIPPAKQLCDVYAELNFGSAVERFNQSIKHFTGIVSMPPKWPKLNPMTDSLDESPDSKMLLTELDAFEVSDSTSPSPLFFSKKRIYGYLDLFKESIRRPGDSILTKIIQLINYNLETYPSDLSNEEKELMGALSTYCSSKKEQKVQTATAQAARSEFETVIEAVNGNLDPSYRFGKAVEELQAILVGLDQAVDRSKITMINKYIESAKQLKNSRMEFSCKIVNIPADAHLHIEVTGDGANPEWSDRNQIYKDDVIKFKWKIGDDIHVAIDLIDHECSWGKKSSETVVLTDDYAIFKMEEGIAFENIGKKVKVSLSPALKDILPTLK